LIATVALEGLAHENLAPASGCQNHTTSPSAVASTKATRRTRYQARRSFARRRIKRRSSCAATASTASRPTFGDDGQRPSFGRDGGITKGVSSKRPSEIFLRKGLDVSGKSPGAGVRANLEFCSAQALACLLVATAPDLPNETKHALMEAAATIESPSTGGMPDRDWKVWSRRRDWRRASRLARCRALAGRKVAKISHSPL
jgi:hypothetical protein